MEQHGQVIGRDHAHPLDIFKILITAAGDQPTLGQAGIVDQAIHFSIGGNDPIRKGLQVPLFGHVARIPHHLNAHAAQLTDAFFQRSGRFVDDGQARALLAKGPGNTAPNAQRAAGHHANLSIKPHPGALHF